MAFLFLVGVAAAYWAESYGNPQLAGVNQSPTALQAGGNMEGKEVRFGIPNTALFAAVTTDASCGAVNGLHDSFTPLGGMVPLLNIMLGEIIFGGVGSGLYGILVFVILAVFIAGLMVGRTPEYLGKKIESHEVKMGMIAVLISSAVCLVGAAVATSTNVGLSSLANKGPHGLSEILYAFLSAANNNGSAFAGLTASTPFYDLGLGLAMLLGRYWLAIPTLAIAGSLAAKKKVPAGPGTLPTHTPLFVFLLISVVLVVGALAFFPALALGPIVEHLLLGGS